MRLDALTLSAIRDEIDPALSGARIQKVAFPDDFSVALETYAPPWGRARTLLSVHPEIGRVMLVSDLPDKGVDHDSPFALLVRKHLRSGRIVAVRQPLLERVLEIEIERWDEDSGHYRVLLIVEAMGRRGNLVLVGEDGAVLDALRRAPPSRNPSRPLLPHRRYAPPAAQERLSPEQLSATVLAEHARGTGGLLADHLLSTVAGLSPLASREIAFRSTGSVGAPVAGAPWEGIAEVLRDMFRPLADHSWAPTLAVRSNVPIAYAPYPLLHLQSAGASLRSYESMSAAMESFYAAGVGMPTTPRRGDPLHSERTHLLDQVQAARRMQERRLAALEREIAEATARDDLRTAGETILAHQYAVRIGAEKLSVEGRSIRLDPSRTPVENAQRYFQRYRKARDASEHLPALREEVRDLGAHLADLEALARVADSGDAIRALRRETASASGRPLPERPPSGRRPSPRLARHAAPHRRVDLPGGWELLVGASAAGNAAVTFDLGRPDDLWLHARGVPGAHAILRGPAAKPPSTVLERAAELTAWYSAARDAGWAEVDVTQRRYVKKIPGGPPGLVRYERERTIRVQPRVDRT